MTTLTDLGEIENARSLIQTYKRSDPRLYQAIDTICVLTTGIIKELQPILKVFEETQARPTTLEPPIELSYILTPSTIRLMWFRPQITGFLTYEIRRGTVWETADFITRTQSTLADVVPVAGVSQTFLIKSMDSDGNYSANAATITVTIEPPGAVLLDPSVIDNNVLLRWTPSTSSFAIDYYEVKKEGTVLGIVRGTFASFFETISGEYAYDVTPIDIVGNRGVSSRVTLLVNQPPDYVLTHSHLSTFQGTRTGVLLIFDPTLDV